MPYIEPKMRSYLDPVNNKEFHVANTAGELNFQLTRLVQAYLDNSGLSYQNINDVIGALEGCKLEFYRRLVASYEDQKIQTNGDVYWE